jgi:hypothetical protein
MKTEPARSNRQPQSLLVFYGLGDPLLGGLVGSWLAAPTGLGEELRHLLRVMARR